MKKDRLLSLALALSMALTGCGPKQAESEGAKTYTGSAQGNNGPVKVEVVVENGGVNAVTVTEHGETPGICDAAIETIPAAIVAGQTLNVEAVSGATNTSKAILEATAAAPWDSLNRGYTQAGAASRTKSSSRAPSVSPLSTARVFRDLPTSRILSARPAPTSRPMMMEAVEARPKATTMVIFSTLPAMV